LNVVRLSVVAPFLRPVSNITNLFMAEIYECS
jgi:hypothetical protein